SQIAFTQGAAAIYWGLPDVFAGNWSGAPPATANETAYGATRAVINATFPSATKPWAEASFEAFFPGWRASFSDPGLNGATPAVRAEAVIARALPAFLDSPFANATFDPGQRRFQLGMLFVFRLGNYRDPSLVEAYALAAFSGVTSARPAFFADVVYDLAANATDPELRHFAREESLRYDPLDAPFVLSINVTRYFVSPDRRIVLMNYGFEKDADYVDADHREPISEDVLVMRDLVARLKAAYGSNAPVYVTGSAPANVDSQESFGGGSEFIVTILLVVILIGLYFRSVVSPAFPILTIAVAIMIANLFVYLVAVYLFTVDFTVTAVLQTVLLATGTDYSIFLVSRYRDERRDGRTQEEAVRNAVVWAGESVTTSGGAVLISFAALSLGSFPILKTMGLTLGFAVTVALLIALTFTPAIVMTLGNRVFWPSGGHVARPRAKGDLTATERYFRGAARFSMRHAKAILLAAVLLTIPATYIVLTDEPTFNFSQGAPPTESSRGIEAISSSFGQGFVYPTVIVVRFAGPVVLFDGSLSVVRLEALDTLSREILAREPGVKSIEGPTNPQGTPIDYRNISSMPEPERTSAIASITAYVGRDHRTVRLPAVLRDEPFSGGALSTIDRIDAVIAEVKAREMALAGSEIYVGGVTAILNDVRDNTNRDLQIMALIVVTGLFIVLLLVLGSVLIPVRAILTILLSISWTLALTILLFHVWRGIDVIFILPLALFVMAMGLGMDYDIFIITRVREEVARGAADPDAITEATTRTGGIISACGIVMAGAFFTLMLNPSPFLQEIGFALAFVILLDSMVVRIYLVPAIMVLAGKYNWWAPGGLQRVRREEKAPEIGANK
ncbi:MAG: MMPL family transporter, partial [Methanobacteriota archaeon]